MKLHERLSKAKDDIHIFLNHHKWFYLRRIMDDYMVYESPRYTRIAPFYLPVYRRHDNCDMVCWILPLAPFVLLFIIAKNVFFSIWRDIISFNQLLTEYIKK